ncbi:ubiquitin-related domain-containing protein [Lasiosphaeria hispida]|uniref:Ubiquitin-related domain-containing protein n=1 Tax=Lasiosphaeria hispida TaxID=260671 RepID=A0AAJ0MEN4_9PEZI|nr:ubiquitin-related domain-containing protein [Lasiosphaeria hispida]
MAENDTQTSSSQQPQDKAPQRIGDAVPMSEMDRAAQKQEATESGFSLPLPAKETQSPTQSDSAAERSKGKGKEDAVDKQREEDSLSIGPSDPQPGSNQEPLVCTITLLLPTGARHPYKIDEKYLAKRSVEVPDVTDSGRKDPFSISVYKLKELILREWREEWEGKPASPSSIRLIFFGKLLDDKEQLKKYQFSADSPNIVHMSVRPADMMEEDEAAKGKTSSRDGRSREGGGGCCVIL